MPIRTGRAKYHSVTLKSNQGTGKVVNYSGFMGRGIVLRKQIMQRATCSKGNDCYTSKQLNPATNK